MTRVGESGGRREGSRKEQRERGGKRVDDEDRSDGALWQEHRMQSRVRSHRVVQDERSDFYKSIESPEHILRLLGEKGAARCHSGNTAGGCQRMVRTGDVEERSLRGRERQAQSFLWADEVRNIGRASESIDCA